jgi:cellulose biosynthesis protein BcsQ
MTETLVSEADGAPLPKIRKKARKVQGEPQATRAAEPGEEPYNPYDPPISRKLMERIVGISTPTLIKYEQDGTISPRRVKRGGQELITYRIRDVHAVLKRRGISFNPTGRAEVIAVFSQKGGVGKSSLTAQLAAMLSLVSPRVLVVDLDSQADATSLLGINANQNDLQEAGELEPSILELIDWTMSDGSDPGIRRLAFGDVVKEASPSLHVIPSDLDLSEVNYNLNRLPIADRIGSDGRAAPGALYVIKEVIDQIRDKYDFILFDLPPNIETCNVAALFAADRVIVPLELEAKTLRVCARNEEFLDRLKQSHSGFSWKKILLAPNKFLSTNIKIKALARVQDIFAGRQDVFLSQVVIPNSTIIDRCAEAKEPIFVTATKTGKEFKDQVAKAREFADIFWILLHEILDLEVDRLLFADADESGV